MKETGYYPMGAEYDPKAPWNERGNEEREFTINVTMTVSREVTIMSRNWEYGYADEPMAKDEDLKQDYILNYDDVPMMLSKLSEYVTKWMPANLPIREKRKIYDLLLQARDWQVENIEVEEA